VRVMAGRTVGGGGMSQEDEGVEEENGELGFFVNILCCL
jgi:hypothetical protein